MPERAAVILQDWVGLGNVSRYLRRELDTSNSETNMSSHRMVESKFVKPKLSGAPRCGSGPNWCLEGHPPSPIVIGGPFPQAKVETPSLPALSFPPYLPVFCEDAVKTWEGKERTMRAGINTF